MLASGSISELYSGLGFETEILDEETSFETRELRNAFGRFATGVAVMTAQSDEGQRVGVTANSFASVSLDPALISWNVARKAPSARVFRHASHFCVHVLTVDQIALSRRFATPLADKFDGLALEVGLGGAPLLPDCAARLECERCAVYEGGDHLILIGRVRRFTYGDRPPLLFYAGRYGTLADLA